MSFFKFIYGALKYPVKLLFRLQVTGLENLPPEDGYLVCSNHTSIIDVFVMTVATGKQINFMAKKELIAVPVLGSLVKALGAYPVNRGTADTTAIKHTISVLEEGKLVGMFPQGTRQPYKNPRDTEVKHGIGLVSYRAKCGIQPIFIKTKKNKAKFFHKTEVIIGKHIPYEDLGFVEGGMKEYNAVAEKVFDIICSLGEN